MSHTTRTRGPAIECPLASLGRNNPNQENHQTYHHPLSTSPLNPQVYQMSRKSPHNGSDENLLFSSSNNNNNNNHNNNDETETIDETDSPPIKEYNINRNHQNYNQNSHKQRQLTNSSPSPSTSTASDHQQQQQNYNGHQQATQQQSMMTYQSRLSPVEERSSYVYNCESLNYGHHAAAAAATTNSGSGNSSEVVIVNCQDQYFLKDRMHALYIRGGGGSAAIQEQQHEQQLDRQQSNQQTTTHYQHHQPHQPRLQRQLPPPQARERQLHNASPLQRHGHSQYQRLQALQHAEEQHHQQQNSHSSLTERYFLEDTMDNISCTYSTTNHSRIETSSPTNFFRRSASSPSETSGSDRYLLERGGNGANKGSPAPPTRSYKIPTMHNSSGNNNNHYKSKYHPTRTITTFVDGVSRVGGRFSPSLDQGYATLVSPSPSGQQTPGPWNNRNSTLKSGPLFDKLPDGAVIKIFEWLDSCDLCKLSRVCRRFESIVWKPVLWKSISLKGEYILADKAIKTILRRLCDHNRTDICQDVEKVMLSDGCRITDKGLQLLVRRCPELTHLQIQYSIKVTNGALFDVTTKCTNLQHLDITGCSQVATLSCNPQCGFDTPRLLLQFLDLTDCCSISDEGLKTIVKNCPQLVYLYLRRCIQITDAGLKYVPSFCVALRELSVSDCNGITDFGLYELAKLGATLRYLSVAKCDQVSDAGLKVIARRCYKLRYLNARGCEAVSDDSITVLAKSCPRIRALDIGKCDVSDTGLRALAESCPNLKKLSLKNCDMITDRGIQCIAYYCRGLQQLNIQDCQVTIEGYRAVKRYCKRCIIEHTNPGFY